MTQVLPLDTRTPIADANGMPTPQFIQYWQQLIGQANNAAGALMPVPAPVTIYQDYTGTPLSGELPRMFAVKRYLNAVDVSAKTRWFLTVKSGSMSVNITQTGVITITSAGAGGVLTLKSVRDNVTLQCDFPVNTLVGSPPTTGTGGGSSGTATTFASISSSTQAPITADVTATVGSTGVVNLQATLNVLTARTAPVATYPVYGQWYWYNGASYVAIGSEVRSNPDCSITSEAQDTTPVTYLYYRNNGSLSVSASKSGLTVGSAQKFQFYARNDVSTPSRTMTFTGTASAIGA